MKAIHRVMTVTKYFAAALMLLCVILSCELRFGYMPFTDTGSFTVDLAQDGRGQRTVMPDVEIAISYYEVSGAGPSLASFGPEETSGTSFTKSGLAVGSWSITVQAFSVNDVLIGEGTTIILIESGTVASGTVVVYLLGGTGILEIHVSWPSGVLTLPSVSADIIAPGGSTDTVIFQLAGDKLSASWTKPDAAVGSHFGSATIFDGGVERRSFSEDFFVVSGGTTSGSYAFTADQLQSGVSKPSLSLSAGTYAGARTLTINSGTDGASIRYTDNGTIPTLENGINYSGSISIPTSRIITAVAFKDGQPSAITRASYTITGTIAVPQFGKRPGVYFDPITVTLSCATSGAIIMYTTNGSEPAAFSGEVYSGSISVSADTTIKAIAKNADGSLVSTVTQAAYSITGHIAAVEASLVAGTFYAEQSVELTCPTSDAAIRYTLNGTEPTNTTGILYGGAIAISQSTTVTAKAFKEDWADSETLSLPIELKVPEVAIAPGTNTIDTEFNSILTKTMSQATIRYTVNGDAPSASVGEDCVTNVDLDGYVYIDHTLTLRAIAIRSGWTDSDVSMAVYTMKCAMPTFTPQADTYGDASFTATMASTTPNCQIVSTINDSTPVPDQNGAYGTTRSVTTNTVIQAVAARSGWTTSDAIRGVFNVGLSTFSPANGAMVYDSTPLIDWPARVIAASYEIELASTEVGLTGDTPIATVASHYLISTPLTDGEIVWWRTRTIDASNNPGTWSAVASFTYDILNDMVFVPGGSFQMGSASGEADELPIHTITLSAFSIGKYEVTQAFYESVMGNNPSSFTGDGSRPVEQVTWYDAVEFCNKLSEQEGLTSVYTITGRNPASGFPISSATVTMDRTKNGYRLPTEAEWEYAARGGRSSVGYTYSGSNTANNVAWYSDNASSTTHPVGTKEANELGIYDMSGNVYEWCWDWYGTYPSTAQTDPDGASSDTYRVLRGGGWIDPTDYLRSTHRGYNSPDRRHFYWGIRVVRGRCAVTYNANGATSGTVPVDSNEYTSGQTATALANTGNLVRTGDTFAGWNTKADGSGTNYAAGTGSFAIPEAGVMLYAKWDGTGNGLIGEWLFSGNANDTSGNGNNGTVNGATLAADRFGNANSAYDFNGTSNYIEIDNTSFLPVGTQPRSLCGWIKDRGGYTTDLRMYFGYGPEKDVGLPFGTSFSLVNAIPKIYFWCWGYGYDITGNTSLLDNTWHFIAAVYNGSNLKVFVDNNIDINQVVSINTYADFKMRIGDQAYNDGADHHVNGLIDDVRIYDRALSDTEISALYKEEGIWTPSLLSYYAAPPVTVGGKVYLLGGKIDLASNLSSDIRIYNTQTATWTIVPNVLPYAILYPSTGAALGDNGKIYFSPAIGPTVNGGWGAHNRIVEFDPATNTAMEKAVLSSGNVWASSLIAAKNGKIYCFGGWNGGMLNFIKRYNPVDDSLATLTATVPSTTDGCRMSGICASNGKIYLFDTVARYIYIFDPLTENISVSTARPPFANKVAVSWYAGGDEIYFAGDTGSTVYEYSISGDSISLSAVNFGLGSRAFAYTSVYDSASHKFYIYGGDDASDNALSGFQIVNAP